MSDRNSTLNRLQSFVILLFSFLAGVHRRTPCFTVGSLRLASPRLSSRVLASRIVSRYTLGTIEHFKALGVNLEGHKELLGLWLGENEGAKFWLSCLTDLKNRGLGDIFVTCIDGLSGFADAIRAAYPQTSVQLCIVHLVRAALRYVSTEDSKPVAKHLKKIYQAATVLEAEQALEEFAQGGTPSIRRLPSSGGRSGLTSLRCSTSRRRFVGRSTRPTRSRASIA